MNDRYTLTEHGLVAKFQQECGCNAEGPGEHCTVGKQLYTDMSADGMKLYYEEISMQEADKSLAKWQEHLGA